MLLIPCPFCGPRDETEFTYGGDAERKMPPVDGSASHEDWQTFVHTRANRKGYHKEFWYHGFGCEQWICVERNTVTHEIRSASKADTVGTADHEE